MRPWTTSERGRFRTRMASFLVWPPARASSKIFFALGSQRSSVMAMRYKTALTLRLPPRFRRWRWAHRLLSPRRPAGGGAVEAGEAALAGETPGVTDLDQ